MQVFHYQDGEKMEEVYSPDVEELGPPEETSNTNSGGNPGSCSTGLAPSADPEFGGAYKRGRNRHLHSILPKTDKRDSLQHCQRSAEINAIFKFLKAGVSFYRIILFLIFMTLYNCLYS